MNIVRIATCSCWRIRFNRYDNIVIKYYVTASKIQEWQEVGSYSPIIYTTLKEPLYGNLDEKMLYFSCRVAKDLTSQGGVINAIWDKFELNQQQPKGGLYLKDFDPSLNETQVGYYLSNYMNNIRAESLFLPNSYSGECAAFQDLFTSLLSHHGIETQLVSLSPINTEDQFFLVRNWRFIANGTSGNPNYPYVNYPSIVEGDEVKNRLKKGAYGWVGTPEVIETQGIAGQGNDNPYSDFNEHFIVKVGNIYYDPSYGQTFDSIREWEDDAVRGAVAGFYREVKYRKGDGKESIKIVLRKNSSSPDIKEK